MAYSKIYPVPQISSVQDMIIKSASKYGDKIALEDLNPTLIPKLTFAQLLTNVLKFGRSLNSLGIKERDHIAVISENRVQWALTYLTAMAFNMVIVPIDKNLPSNEILNIIHESESEAIIFSNTFENFFREKKDTLLKLKHFISMDLLSKKNNFHSMTELINNTPLISINELSKINPTELAQIIFTSGSLGRAKGVMLTQKNLASNLMAMCSLVEMKPADKFLSVLPIHHTYECTCGLLCPVYSGCSVHYARSLKTIVDDLQNVIENKKGKAILLKVLDSKGNARYVGLEIPK